MIEILNRWTRAVVYQSESAQTIAEAVIDARKSGADLREANLCGANLRRADLSGADLCGANLCRAYLHEAKQIILRIQGSQHEITAINDDIRIGCLRRTLADWLAQFEAIGQAQHYTPNQIAEYGMHLRHIGAVLQLKQPQPAAPEVTK